MYELIFQELVIKELKENNNIYILNTCMKYTIGIPDLLISLNGKFIAIELKVAKKEQVSLQSIFPKSRKQIATLYDIEKSGAKGYGLVLFNKEKMVMLFRINFVKFPLSNSQYFKHINLLTISPFCNSYNEFIECYVSELNNIKSILEFIK